MNGWKDSGLAKVRKAWFQHNHTAPDRVLTLNQRYRIEAQLADSQTELVRAHLDSHGWVQTEDEDWDLYWADFPLAEADFAELTEHKRVNQFPGIGHLATKDGLWCCLSRAAERARRAGETEVYDFFPRSYLMPEDYEAFLEDAQRHPEKLWILKPEASALGEGIEMVSDPAHVSADEDRLVQEYIANPLLLPGEACKHTLRIYAALTSLDPLEVHIFRGGLAKYTSRPFTAARESLADRVVHLTNPSVQMQNEDVDDPIRAVDFGAYREQLRESGVDDDALWLQIRSVLAQTFIAAREPILAETRPLTPDGNCCFQFLGCDLLIDDRLKPWLLECNIGPALTMRSPKGTPGYEAQKRTKGRMIAGLLGLVGITQLDDHEGNAGFEALFPASDTKKYFACLPLARPGDRKAVPEMPTPTLHSRDVVSRLEGDEVLLDTVDGRHLRLNRTAAYVWLRHEEGAEPEAVAAEVADMFPDAPNVGRDVWDCFCSWVDQGLIEARWPKS